MTTITTTEVASIEFSEPLRHYRVNWSAVSAKTDTPDLIGVFREAEIEALMAEGYAETADEDLELAEADMAAGFETLPAE